MIISLVAAVILALTPLAPLQPVAPSTSPVDAAAREYVPPRASWASRPPAELGFNPDRLAAVVAWAKEQETDMPRDFSTQVETFGRPLGAVPSTRALTNGLILRHGYIVAEWGETDAVDPTYSVAKSYLSTLLGLAVDRGLIADVNDPVAWSIKDGGYDSVHNAKVTWAHHATQTSEWEGEMFGKTHTFIGKEEFGRGERKPRELREPGECYEYNDVRINRFALSLMRAWDRPLQEVLRSEVMDPIGASGRWVYHGYDNSEVEVGDRMIRSVSGGTRWGGGLWISTRDHARFGLLILRKGEWGGTRIISEQWLHEATTPKGKNPGYGYLWWLNSDGKWPDAPRTSFAAIGAGSNTIWIDPEHDLVVVWRWHQGGDAINDLCKRVIGAMEAAGEP